MSKKGQAVPRPIKRAEYPLVFHSREAQKGWQDLLAVAANAMTDAWDQLRLSPTQGSDRQYRLKADYATLTWQGRAYDRWQYKVTNGARIWYFIAPDPQGRHPGIVRLERCDPAHPKETD